MRFGCNDTFGNFRPRVQVIAIEIAELETCYQQSTQAAVEVCLLDITTAHSCGQVSVFGATFYISASQHSLRTGFSTVLGSVVPSGQEVADSAAIAGDDTLEAPLIAQDLLFITSLGAAGLTVDTLVGAHNLCYLSLLYECLESGEIGLPEITFGEILDIERMAVPLWAAMHGEVLGAGQEFAVFFTQPLPIVRISLQSSHHCQAHFRG